MSGYFIKQKREEVDFEEILLDEKHKDSGKIDNYFDSKKIRNLGKIFAVIIFGLFTQLFYLQFVQGNYYSSISDKNYIRTVKTRSARGIIYDRNMSQIVFNVPVFDLVIVPADFFKDRDEVESKKKKLAAAMEISEADFSQKIKDADPMSYESFVVLEKIEKEKMLVLDEKIKNMAGVKLESSAIRNYIDGQYFSSVIGYSGRINEKELKANPDYLLTDVIGKEGTELSYEQDLRGTYGTTEVEVDSLGKVNRTMQKAEPAAGNNLVLNIDAALQKRLYKDVEEMAVKKAGSTGGSVVAINPQNGAVLALVTYPSYNNNAFEGGISTEAYNKLLNDPDMPLFNRAIAAAYPPGSTFKPMIAAAALQENVISPTRQILDSGSLRVGAWTFGDWAVHGQVDMVKAIAQSCDVYFYTVGGGYGDIKGLGVDRIKKYAELFGMGKLTGIDIPGEKAGTIPDAAWKKTDRNEPWYIGDTYHISIGQGDVLTTPLQIANYTAAVANGGTLYRPQLVDKIVDGSGSVVRDIAPEILRQNFIDPANMAWVQKGMRENVVSGSGKSLSTLSVEAAGKTGTAQYAGNTKTHAWYTVYAPYQNPEIVMAIMLEGGGEGHDASAPIAKDILQWYFGERLTGVSSEQAAATVTKQ
ncbi:MAG: penicillin-binding protein 2 [Patescibacteria group bacterium]